MSAVKHEIITSVVQSKSTIFGNDAGPKAFVVGNYEAACIALTIHDRKVNGICEIRGIAMIL